MEHLLWCWRRRRAELRNLLNTQTERIANKLRSSIIDDLMLLLDSDHESLARKRSRADTAEEELDHLRQLKEARLPCSGNVPMRLSK